MEAYPLGVFAQHQTRRDQQLSKVVRIYAFRRMSLKVNPRTSQKLDRIRAKHVLREIENEVELPSAYVLRHVPVLIRERQTDLYDTQEIDVTPHRLVVVVARRPEDAYGPRDDTRELCVL